MSLTTAAPRATRAFVVRIASEKPSGESVDVELTAQVTARLRASDPTNPSRILLRAKLSVDGPFSGAEETSVLGEPGEPVELQARTIAFDACKLGQGCEWSAALELGFQEDFAEGIVDVDWNVVATARAVGTSELPAGFIVHISEP